MGRKKYALKEDRLRAPVPGTRDEAYLAKLERLRKAIDDGVRSGRARDSSIESIIAELTQERKARRR